MFRRPSVRYGRTPQPETPYQKAAQVWDERIGSARVQAKNWRLMAFGSLILSAALALSLVWQSLRGTVTPWVVQVDRLGQAQAIRLSADRSADRLSPRALYRGYQGIAGRSDRAAPTMVARLRLHHRSRRRRAQRFRPQQRSLRQSRQDADLGRGLQRHPRLAGFVSRRLDPARLREWLARHHRAMDRDSDRRDSNSARRRSFTEESARSLRQRRQLVEGVGTMTPPFRGVAVPASRKLAHVSFCKSALTLLLMSASMLAGCSHLQKPPEIALDDPAEPAVLLADPPAPVEVVELPKPLPLPGQLKPLARGKHTPEPADPAARVHQANAAARVQPVRNGFINAVQVYPFTSGALYQVYTAPGQITDVALQAGEQLTGSGPV